MGRKTYSKAFKDEACKLVTEQKQAIASAATGLWIAEQTLRYWLTQRGWSPEQSTVSEQLAESDDPRWLKTRIRDSGAEAATGGDGTGDFKKSDGLLREPAAVKFAWMKEHAARFEVQSMCQALEVSPCGYYAWRKRPASGRCTRRSELIEHIRAAHEGSRRTYGSPRVAVELKAAGVSVCENTVARYMREEGLASKIKRRFRVMTTDSNHAYPVAENVLDRSFKAQAPDRKWCVDITYIRTGEGWLYLSAVIDLFSRRIVGWAMADHLRSELCLEALSMAIGQRKPAPGLLHHSDRGVQFACEAYRWFLDRHQMEPSMSRRGNCHDNAVMESFWGTLKTELVYHEEYATRAEAEIVDL